MKRYSLYNLYRKLQSYSIYKYTDLQSVYMFAINKVQQKKRISEFTFRLLLLFVSCQNYNWGCSFFPPTLRRSKCHWVPQDFRSLFTQKSACVWECSSSALMTAANAMRPPLLPSKRAKPAAAVGPSLPCARTQFHSSSDGGVASPSPGPALDQGALAVESATSEMSASSWAGGGGGRGRRAACQRRIGLGGGGSPLGGQLTPESQSLGGAALGERRVLVQRAE